MARTDIRTPRFWAVLSIGAIGTAIIALSIHVLMLQVLGVPFPNRSLVGLPAKVIQSAIASLALFYIYGLSQPRLARYPWWSHVLIIAILCAMLREVMRGAIMDGVVTTAVLFAIAKATLPMLQCLIVATLIVVIAPYLRSLRWKLAASLMLGALMVIAVGPLLEALTAPVITAMSYLAHDDVYQMPYGAYVLAFAYGTFLEPVIACLAIAALLWPALSPRGPVRTGSFALLVMAVKGSIVPTLLYSLYNPAGPAIGVLSESQFLLEALALALLTAWTWTVANGRVDKPRQAKLPAWI